MNSTTELLTWYNLTLILRAVETHIELLETDYEKHVHTSGRLAAMAMNQLSQFRVLERELKKLRKMVDEDE